MESFPLQSLAYVVGGAILVLPLILVLLKNQLGLKLAANLYHWGFLILITLLSVIIILKGWEFYKIQGNQWEQDGNVAAPALIISGSVILLLFIYSYLSDYLKSKKKK